MSSPTLQLNNGLQMPQVGLGIWKIPNESTADMVYLAIKTGYRTIDSAMDYGNEVELGQGIKRALDEGICERKDLFIVSKLWNSFHAKENVRKAINKVLKDTQLDYLDAFYIHFPIAQKFIPIEEKYPPGTYCGDGDKIQFEDVPIIETYRALEELVDEGLIKSIGISNFNGALILDLLRGCRIKPALLQIEHHPYLVQKTLVQYAQSQEIVVVAYSSFGPQSFLEMNNKGALNTPTLFEHEVVTSIAKTHDVSPAAVLLRWATQRKLAIIPKSTKPERLQGNLKVNDFTLSPSDLESISSLDQNLRFNDPWDWCGMPIFY